MRGASGRLMSSGTLYIVATPIGNLEDMTFRGVRILKEVGLIAAEDTRHSRKLLTHFGISRPLTSYYDHNKEFKGEYLLDRLREGVSVALISDAGTPCISDPGYQLVRDAVASGISVVPVPGPSAATAALSASGLPTDSFTFIGFPPNRQGKRKERLAALKGEQRLLVFYESPKRLPALLADMEEIFGDRYIVIAREITKIHEEFVRGTVSRIRADLGETAVRGEVVILVSPAGEDEEKGAISFVPLLEELLKSGDVSLKDAVKRVSLETGTPRGEVYDAALLLKKFLS